ncbi:MAG: hypothetical protein R2847_02220 [Bacteroidia bacterium]
MILPVAFVLLQETEVAHGIRLQLPQLLMFDIVPNDWNGFNETDYDFAVWRIAGLHL